MIKTILLLALLVVVGAALLPLLISTRPIAGLDRPQVVAQAVAQSITPSDSQFVTIPFDGTDGIAIHYLARSQAANTDAPKFVLLHGFTFNAFTWNRVLGFFGERGRAVAYDQPPYGLSAKLTPVDWRGPDPYTREAAVTHLFAVMDALTIDQAILVGNSAGGSLALEAALAYPERVAGLILIDPWVYVRRPTLPPWLAELPQLPRLTLLMARQLGRSDALLRRAYADPTRITPEQRRLAGIHAQVQDWDLAWGALLHRSLTSSIQVSTRLAEIPQPTLVVTGDADRLVPPADSERLVAALPNAQLVTLPDCGHMPQQECPGPLVEAMGEWLD